MLDLNEIAVFTKVVEAQSFTGGARLLNMPKATVSRKVSELEARLGVRLLERTTRKLRLTEEGHELFTLCSEHVSAIEHANKAITDAQTEPQGTLRISMPTIGQEMLCELVAEFLELYPKVNFEIAFSDEIVDLIGAGFDLAFRGGMLADSSLIARKLGPTKPVICASPDYLDRRGIPRTPAELRLHDCVILDTSPHNAVWEFQTAAGAEEIEVRGRIKANDAGFILNAALAGLGIGRLPSFIVAEHVRGGRLNSLLNEFNPSFGNIYIVYPSRHHLSTKVRAFVAFVEQRMKPNAAWPVELD